MPHQKSLQTPQRAEKEQVEVAAMVPPSMRGSQKLPLLKDGLTLQKGEENWTEMWQWGMKEASHSTPSVAEEGFSNTQRLSMELSMEEKAEEVRERHAEPRKEKEEAPRML